MPKANPRIALIVSKFNRDVTYGLRDGALAYLREKDVSVGLGDIFLVPGAFEIPVMAKSVARAAYDGVICLGCVIKGETAHFEYISEAVAHGLMAVMLDTGKPVSFGILTTYTEEQAAFRSALNDHNKGREAAAACLEAIIGLGEIPTPS